MAEDFLSQTDPAQLDELYQRYLADPESVEERWRIFFAGFELGAHAAPGPEAGPQRPAPSTPPADLGPLPEPALGVFDLIHSYRELGHLIANLDPLGANETSHPLLELDQFGFSDADLDREVRCPNYYGCESAVLRDLIVQLRATYCSTLAVEYMFIPDKEQREWLQERIEPQVNDPHLSDEECAQLLGELMRTNAFEQFLATKYIGKKRFSIEGSESLVPMLNRLIEEAGAVGVQEVVMGMAHRGRLNVMANVLGKPYGLMLAEFEGSFLPAGVQGDGDVKYHLGYAREYVTRQGNKLHVSLMPNPSHLEVINPVVEGIVHAKQQYLQDTVKRSRVMPILVHGDAAFTGQGIVMETLSLSELKPYHNGGSIHVIVDNQIGFTTAPSDVRFTRYPSDLAKVINAPVFHVNADDPEAAVRAAELAMGFRERFQEDVIIHLLCYRRHGHNELDDPTFTQPLMYKKIREKRPAHELYADHLVAEGRISHDRIERERAKVRTHLDKALNYARDVMPQQKVFAFGGIWEGMGWAGHDWSAATNVSLSHLNSVMRAATKLPPEFNAHPKVKRLLETRAAMAEGEGKIDWACAEMLAFGTLLTEGTNVRLSGQDSGRGTFSQRHAILHDSETDELYVPLNRLESGQGRFRVIDTMLSEAGVLGFEYGYASADPRNLVIWEAQYGDFVNGAQVIIDQFIAASESKWQRQNGIVLLLPHGLEGQGSEHSSARLERFLQLCAEENMQVVYPTTPAQYFHVLRRQIHRNFRKPLIIMAPKSMLRLKLAVSPISAFTDTAFENVIGEIEDLDASRVERVLLCSGKVYYDLLVGREARVRDNVAIIRVEQLYPFPADELEKALAQYPETADVVWVQEEAQNQGAWQYIRPHLEGLLGSARAPMYAGRDDAASPATGSFEIHGKELADFIDAAFKMPHTIVDEEKAHAG
jgi:2-oxoglutarate dehydrogenase E1 component